MDFQNLTDAKVFMGEIAGLLPEDTPHYEDFQFFSAINCTTQPEYRQELKAFLEAFIVRTAVLDMPDPVKGLYPKLVRLYGWL